MVVFMVIVFLLLGYYAMDKVDTFLVNNNSYPSNECLSDKYPATKETKPKVILIYGDNELAKLVKAYCNSENHIYEAITDFNDIGAEKKYLSLLALSYKDVDNLMMASVGLKIYGISHVIALCNSQNNLKLYNEFNFDKVILYKNEMDGLFNIVKEFVQNAIENEV
jgi:hypothetical protein